MKRLDILSLSVGILLMCFLAGCASHPLSMSDEEWARLTPEQQLEAHKEQARLDNERRIKAMEDRRRAEELRLEEERLQMERDIASGMIAHCEELCIGGPKCPGRDDQRDFILSLQRFAYVDKIVFYADDFIGRRHDARIAIYADHHKVADNIDIKKSGSEQTVFVGRVARNIIIKTLVEDEVHFHSIKVFGELLEAGTVDITM